MAEQGRTDPFSDMKEQFKEMHQSLEHIAENTKPVAELAKNQIRKTRETPPNTLPQGDKKALLQALKAIKDQISPRKPVREATAGGVAADILAGGGTYTEATKEALAFRKRQFVKKFKRRFDPLNVVHRLTGGSKLATTLAGRVMGRSEASIRSASGLAGGDPSGLHGDGPSPSSSSPTQETSGGFSESPAQMGEQSSGALEAISTTLSQILKRVINIETYEEQNIKLIQKQLDAVKDRDALTGAKKSPRLLGQLKTGTDDSSGLGGFKKFVMGLIDGFKLPLIAAIVGLGIAAAALYAQWDKLKLSFFLLKDSAVDMWEGIKTAFSDAGAWVSKKAIGFVDTIKDMFDSIVEYVQDLIYTVTFGKAGKKARTAEQKQADIVSAAKGGDSRAQRKLDEQQANKVATVNEQASAVGKHAASFAQKIPSDSREATIKGLKRGEYDAAAIASLSGQQAPTGSPEQRAATGAITQLVSKSYGDVFGNDAQGKPLRPSTDTKENREKRLPELVRQASASLAQSLETGTTAVNTSPSSVSAPVQGVVPSSRQSSPTEMAPAIAQTGEYLSQAADNRRSVTNGPGAGGGNLVNNNVRNNQSNITNLLQNMPSARSSESSFLRSLDRDYVPA
jgi:hypothetical protein